MALSLSPQTITSGAFGSFVENMYKTAGNQYGPAIALLKLDETLFDITSLLTPSLGAGNQVIGSVIGRTTMTVVTPAVTSNGAYALGNEIGPLMTFPVGGNGTGGELKHVRVTSKSVLATNLTAYVFATNPSASTWTDKTAPAINTADIAGLLCPIPLMAAYSGLGTHTVWLSSNIGVQFSAANLYVVLVIAPSSQGGVASTLTSGSTSDFTVELGMRVD